MPKKSAGLLVYRKRSGAVEVLLVHPGGPFWARKDAGAWSIPKGEFSDEKDPLEAAQREFQEETGITLAGEYHPLAPIRQSGGKLVHAWAVEGNLDAEAVKSNSFSIEWPPRSGAMRDFPEIDRAGWFTIESAKQKILKGQLPLLEQLENMLGMPGQHSRIGGEK